jgi:hypothetical protein
MDTSDTAETMGIRYNEVTALAVIDFEQSRLHIGGKIYAVFSLSLVHPRKQLG